MISGSLNLKLTFNLLTAFELVIRVA